jgi:hypothetical protein
MRHKLVVVLLLLGIAQLACTQPAKTDVSRRLVGTWRAVSSEETFKDGRKRPDSVMGPHGRAFLIYAADGHMCVELMNPDRPAWKDRDKPTNEEKASSYDGFEAYCGRYEVNEATHTIVHLPEVALWPNYPGTKQVRPYRFEGDRLIYGSKVTDDPEIVAWQIVWERVK